MNASPALFAIFAAATIAVLVVPLCAAAIALARVQQDYYARTVRILGRMFIATAGGLVLIGAAAALSRGVQPFWPYLVITMLPALAVARIMQLYADDPPSS